MEDQELLKMLREAFETEAAERLESLSANLLRLEQVEGVEQRLPILEVIYREAHSLKGAARVVNLTDVEMLCQSFESLLAKFKKSSAPIPCSFFDLGQDCAKAVREFLDRSNREDLPPDNQELAILTGKLSRFHPEKPDKRADETPVEKSVESATPGNLENLWSEPLPAVREKSVPAFAKSLSACAPEPVIAKAKETKKTPDSGGIRIAPEKLDAVLRKAEEMIGLKLANAKHMESLKELRSMAEASLNRLERFGATLKTGKSGGRPRETQTKDGGEGLARFFECEREQAKKTIREMDEMVKFVERFQRGFSKKTDDLLEETKSAMLRPCADLFNQFPLMVRDFSRQIGKKVDFEIEGAHIEIDRRILERMKDPLMHLIRNALDHGIEFPEERRDAGKVETAVLRLVCTQAEGKKIEIVFADDGRGIDVESVKKKAVGQGVLSRPDADAMSREDALNLIFRSGISTAAMVTEISGRGLGMAIVSERVESLGGDLFIDSLPGDGTVFTMRLPVTLATFRGVLVKEAGAMFVLPSTQVRRVIRVYRDQVKTAENRRVLVYREKATSLVDLASVLKISRTGTGAETNSFFPAVVIGAGDAVAAFRVDEVLGEEEILVKDLGKQLKSVPFVSGATVLGSGMVVPILSARDLLNARFDSDVAEETQVDRKAARRKKILLAEDSITSRMLLKNILESAGYDVFAAVNGREAYDAIMENVPDLVVSDVEMPEMNGFELTRKIRKSDRFESLPVILVTTLSSMEDRERGIDAGASAYIVKSDFDQKNLLETVGLLI